jgi:transglutaminase-like putative cysteine protease
MPVVSILHRTTYRYRNPVAFGEHRVMHRPLESYDQRVISAALKVGPEPALLRHVQDSSGAAVAVARFDTRADRLSFESEVTVEHTPSVAFDLERDRPGLGAERFVYGPDEADDLARCIARRHVDDGEVEAWTRRFLRPVGRTRLSTLLSDMTHAIRADFTYAQRLQGAARAPLETLTERAGSCRDFAVLMIDAARSLGLAARFTSGYIYGGSPKAGRTGGGHTHAWARVYLPDCGWTDFDPTNGIVGNADLIRVAEAVDPRSAIPLHGTWSGLQSDYLGMDVEVDVANADAEAQLAPLLRVAQRR